MTEYWTQEEIDAAKEAAEAMEWWYADCHTCGDTGSVPSTDQPGMFALCPDCQSDEAGDHVQQWP